MLNSRAKLEEKELIVRIVEGDQEAFERIYYTYAKRVYYFASRYLKNKHQAEEIVQEVFVKIWENRKRLNPDMSLSGYLLTTTKNTIFNDHRKQVNHEAYYQYVLHYLQKNNPNMENEIIYNDLMELLQKTLGQLPDKRKEIFELSRFQGLSYKEIASQLNITEKTIESHMRLAIRDIKKVIEPVLGKLI